ncbi:hypothetical protein GUITHDRAFT_85967 [Guillardia theta CCMP2712]|uniref:Ribosomal protein n=1 Tax=Guillardia theta (strain CCMP2712) TaxID=905079 RepID=L1JK46_GUITC|nr:hypothetical protein GUITHDRAFT_85967 [Guillardia theta CCMP2712]EKX48851.1 hypothetical protein GUITHDRAFT_85967 [Guillardia theta CCMP2712]|eukprot:XP_005835831.1 hypothetical protein GUITHDRAFT_85967 [Guillardia theta CCMP2712]
MALRAACAAGSMALRKAGRPAGAAAMQGCFMPSYGAGFSHLMWGTCATTLDGRRFASQSTNKLHDLDSAVQKVLKGSDRKFVESVEVCIETALDPRKADHLIRGLVKLPHGNGKSIKIAVFATGEAADAAKRLGVENVGLEDLIEKVKEGKLDFERCLATPQAMPKLNSIARILGPRGLMPNPKTQTVTEDIEKGIKDLRSGLVFKVDKAGYIHGCIGKIDYTPEQIKENLSVFVSTITDLRPKSLSGQFLKSCLIKCTMGKAFKIKMSELTGTSSETASPSSTSEKKESDWCSIPLDLIL